MLAKNPEDAGEVVDGPSDAGTAPDGTAYFSLPLSRAIARVRGGATELCGPPLNNIEAKRLLATVTKRRP